jgi:hypothetical protein
METYFPQGALPFDLQSVIDQELEQSEVLRWSSQPSVSQAFKKALPAVFGGTVWLAFSIVAAVAIYAKSREGEDVPVMVMVIMGFFILIGLLLLTSPFWAVKTAKNTVYAITNQRAIIAVKKGSVIDIQSFREDKLRDINKRIRSDGSGDLIFERQVSHHHSRKHGTHEHTKEIGFFGIPAVNQVQDIIETLIKQQ